jgi:hypothetical protein
MIFIIPDQLWHLEGTAHLVAPHYYKQGVPLIHLNLGFHEIDVHEF